MPNGYIKSQHGTPVELVDATARSKMHEHSNKTVLDGITSAKITEWNDKSTFSGSYNDLSDKPVIPDMSGIDTIINVDLNGNQVAYLDFLQMVGKTRRDEFIANVTNGEVIFRTSDMTEDWQGFQFDGYIVFSHNSVFQLSGYTAGLYEYDSVANAFEYEVDFASLNPEFFLSKPWDYESDSFVTPNPGQILVVDENRELTYADMPPIPEAVTDAHINSLIDAKLSAIPFAEGVGF